MGKEIINPDGIEEGIDCADQILKLRRLPNIKTKALQDVLRKRMAEEMGIRRKTARALLRGSFSEGLVNESEEIEPDKIA